MSNDEDNTMDLDDLFGLAIHAEHAFYTDTLRLWVFAEFGNYSNPERYVLRSAEFERVPEGEKPQGECLELERDQAQRLMDSMWNAGYRPSDGVTSPPSDDARKQHIKDLREVTMRLFDLHNQDDR